MSRLRTPVLTAAALALLAAAAMAQDLGTRDPDGPAPRVRAALEATTSHAPPPEPAVRRQGGDTIADAVPLALPVPGITGTTAGYTDDYDEVCPYSGSTAPDVVYSLQPATDVAVDIDLLGSQYDTKVYVYDEALALVACNDDFYPDYVSRIENLALQGGVTYYVVVDGYGGEAGPYVLAIGWPVPPCILDCDSSQTEGEPPLVHGYQDAHNGGCNSPEFGSPFQPYLYQLFCGTSGWYVSADGTPSRDTDWFEVQVGPNHEVELFVDAEQPTYVFELAPRDCGEVAVVQSLEVGPCNEGVLTIPAEPGSVVWVWIGPTTFEGPVDEYGYTLFRYWWTATEHHTWSAVKAMFDERPASERF